MPQCRLVAGTIVVIEQRKLLGERMMIRRDIAPELHERGIAVALRHIAEHLIVGAVLLEDVEDVLDRRTLAQMHRDGMP
jgi:hypothetical protein